MAIGVSMVLLREDHTPKAADIAKELAARWPDLPTATDLEDTEDIVSLRIAGSDVIMAKMPAPFPWSDLEGPCATSVLWPKAAEELKPHKLHWIVTVNGELEPIELSTLLTQATAALLAASPGALGVYWGNATLLVPKGIFIDFAEQVMPHGPPLHIWVDFRCGKDGERSSAGFTAGMTALGHMEFEAQGASEPPGELKERFLALAGYVLENGPVIRDGDTIGEDINERIRVVYSKSAFGHEGQVMRLIYETPSPQKPWWKLW
jgi:hypothetical protein